MNKALLCVIIFGVAYFMAGCSVSRLAGGGTESTNGRVVGMLVDTEGKPATRTRVMLITSNYDPVKDGPVSDSMTSTTDTSGKYTFTKVNDGNYTVLAENSEKGTRAIVRGIKANDSVAADTLRKPGVVKIMVPAGVNTSTGYVYIPGTVYFMFLKNNPGYVTLDSVPAGKSSDVYFSSTLTASSSVFRYGVQVASHDTATVYNPGWNYSKKFFLNTSASGADVSGSVTNFPVLVRLTGADFDFTQARNNGEDIRFTKPDNTFLSYEIERWDAIQKQAELWVSVDTVRGGDSTQALCMYWGNRDAVALSNSAAVFDTLAGFAGVWHLGQSGAVVSDATVNGINGIGTATAPIGGAIGMAQSFNGATSLIQASGPASDKVNFSDSAAYSISAWVKTNTLDTVCQAIVFKSNAQYGLQIIPEKDWEFNTYIEKTRWEGSRSPASAGAWHLVIGVRNGKKQYLYVDGVCVDSNVSNTIALAPENTARVYDKPLEIGHCPDGGRKPDRFFNGIIDEVRISKIALSADWMKLCYMNQKDRDALVTWQAAQ